MAPSWRLSAVGSAATAWRASVGGQRGSGPAAVAHGVCRGPASAEERSSIEWVLTREQCMCTIALGIIIQWVAVRT